MSWYRLADFPGQTVVDQNYPEIILWEIRDGCVWHQGRKLRSANSANFEVRRDQHAFLGRDGTQVFFAWSRLKDIDRDSFEVLSDGYCRDKSLAYCEFETSIKPLKGRDRQHFVVLGNGYARDSVHAYYCGKPIRGCVVPLTLCLPVQGDDLPYALDRDQVYFEGGALKGADPKAWRLLDAGFSRGEKGVYFGSKKLPGVKLDSWELLGGAYSRGAKSVFVMFLRLAGANPAKWRKLRGEYSTDGVKVYFVERALEGADADSFEVTSGEDDLRQTARDKHGSFSGSQRDA